VSDLPSAILDELHARFGEVSVGEPVGGGCINPAVRLHLSGGDAFLKFDRAAQPGFFSVEAVGLGALRAASSSPHVPEVLGVGDPRELDGAGYLLLEWLEPDEPGPEFGPDLGAGLAELHRESGNWGWETSGFIGPLPVENGEAESWPVFWRERRLRPQLERAAAGGCRIGSDMEWAALWRGLDGLLEPAAEDGPSLLHGDLWSGNIVAARLGDGVVPALVDPSAFRGHREVDLAMAELFGGFPADFLATYEETWPLHPGYRSGRRAAYQLFYLLVHVNLFGGAYIRGAERALRNAIAAS
jgi:protein-ribulosamine 3-kinase